MISGPLKSGVGLCLEIGGKEASFSGLPGLERFFLKGLLCSIQLEASLLATETAQAASRPGKSLFLSDYKGQTLPSVRLFGMALLSNLESELQEMFFSLQPYERRANDWRLRVCVCVLSFVKEKGGGLNSE